MPISYKWNFLRHRGWNFWLCFRLRHIDYFKASDFFKGPKNTIKQMEMIHHKVCISIPYSSLKSRWCLYCESFMTEFIIIIRNDEFQNKILIIAKNYLWILSLGAFYNKMFMFQFLRVTRGMIMQKNTFKNSSIAPSFIQSYSDNG